MISRTRSYTEAVKRGGYDGVFEAVSPRLGLHEGTMRTSKIYISSSSSCCSEDGKGTAASQLQSHPVDFVRSESVKYYDMKGVPPIGDKGQSVREIYETCFEYVSNESLHGGPPKRLSTFEGLDRMMEVVTEDTNVTEGNTGVQLRIVEDGDMVADLNGERIVVVTNDLSPEDPLDRIEDDESFYDDTKESGDGTSSFPVTYTGRNSAKKSRKKPEYFGSRAKKAKRVVFRNGRANVPLRNNIKGRSKLLLDDFVTSMIECQWRWLALYFSACNFLVWLAFAALFYVASYAHGDFGEEPPSVLCIEAGTSFTSIFLFSVETQVSIGYGQKSPNEECPEVIFILLMEVVVGYVMIGGMTCVVYAKIVRPEKQLDGVGFSKKAVVCMRDGKLCLVVRVWDCLQKHSISTQVKGWFVKHNNTRGPTVFPLDLGSSPILLWPTTLQHVIDEKSPMFDMSAKDLIDKRFEVIIALSGGAKNTGQMTQSRMSYLPHEILWGSRFKGVISFNYEAGAYTIDAKNLNTTESVDTPLCSARLLRHVNDALTKEGPISISLPGSPLFGSSLSSPNWSFRMPKLNKNDTFKASLP